MFAAALAGCGDSEQSVSPAPDIALEPSFLEAGCGYTVARVRISSAVPMDFSGLTAESDSPGWCTVSPEGASAVLTVTLEGNLSRNGRSASVTVSDSYDRTLCTLPIRQRGLEIMPEPAILSFGYGSSSAPFRIVSASAVDFSGLSAESDSPEWCTVVTGNTAGEFIVSADINSEPEERRAIVTVYGTDGEALRSLPVTQVASEFTLSRSVLYADRKAGEFSVGFVPADAEPVLVCSEPWCAAAADAGTITVEVGDNPGTEQRTAEVSVSVDGVVRMLNVMQGCYAVGDFYRGGNVEGVIYRLAEDKMHGGIVAPDETVCQWSSVYRTTGASDPDDGLANTNVIRALSGWRENYPAFAWCDARNTEGNAPWYLPAFGELWAICENYEAVNEGLRRAGKSPLTEMRYYWSSTELNNNDASNVRLSTAHWDIFNYKTSEYSVRAVAAF